MKTRKSKKHYHHKSGSDIHGRGVAMDSPKFHPNPPCPTLLRPVGGPSPKQPFGRFRGGPPVGQAAFGRLIPLWTSHAIRLCWHLNHLPNLVFCCCRMAPWVKMWQNLDNDSGTCHAYSYFTLCGRPSLVRSVGLLPRCLRLGKVLSDCKSYFIYFVMPQIKKLQAQCGMVWKLSASSPSNRDELKIRVSFSFFRNETFISTNRLLNTL
jgi:hypothetical protein